MRSGSGGDRGARMRWPGVPAVLICLMACSWAAAGPDPGEPVATFSIVAFDPATGDLGVAVQSRFFGVGSVVPWARAGVGAVATQALANTTYGPRGLELLEKELSAEQALARLVRDDPEAAKRQAALVDARGRPAAWTGEHCNGWAGHRTGEGYSVQGNILAGPKVLDAMAVTFESTLSWPLADRLHAALVAGQTAGGDTRGVQSAAILVVREGGGYRGLNDRYIDLRVEDHADPIGELGRLIRIHRRLHATDDARFHAEQGDHDGAIRIMSVALAESVNDEHSSREEKATAYYNLACFLSLAGRKEEALVNLERAFALSGALVNHADKDPDLDPLRGDPRYNALIEEVTEPEP